MKTINLLKKSMAYLLVLCMIMAQLTIPSFGVEASASATLSITKQPETVYGMSGTAKFSVAANSSDVTYQWQYKTATGTSWKNSTMTGSNTPSISVDITEKRYGQGYRCVVSDGKTSVTSDAAYIRYGIKLEITDQPDDFYGTSGTAKFSVAASKDDVTYKWQYKTPTGTTWRNCTTGGNNTSTLSVDVEEKRNGYKYRCIISDDKSSITSSVAVLHFKEKLSITSQPKDYIGSEGDTAVFSVAVNTSATYQWQYKTATGTTWRKCTTEGYNTEKLSVVVEEKRNGYSYRCIVSDENYTITSNVAVLRYEKKLEITSQPIDFTGIAGDTAEFTVSTSKDDVTYQWQYKTPTGGVWRNCSTGGFDTATLSVSVEERRNGYSYHCIISDGKTTLTSLAANLTVEKALEILAQPKDYSGTDGDTAIFTIESSKPEVTYQWQYKTPTGNIWRNCTIGGYNTASLSVTVEEKRNGYSYHCTISDGKTSLTSVPVVLHYESKLEIISQPSDAIGANGDTAVFSVEVSKEKVTYQWQYKTPTGNTWRNSTTGGYNTNSLSVPIIEKRNGYSYRCIINDGKTEVTSNPAYLYVYNGDTGLTYIFDKFLENEDSDCCYGCNLDLYLLPGTSETVSLTAKNNMQNASFTYQWSKLDYSEFTYYKIEGETSASIMVSEIGEYECKISDGYSTSYAYMSVHYNTELTFIFDKYLENEDPDNYYENDLNLYLVPGTSETVSLTAKNNQENASFTYRWGKYDDSEYTYYDIEGETSASITVSEIGTYECVIDDGHSKCFAYLHVEYNTGLTYIFDKYLEDEDSDNYYEKYLDFYLTPGTSKTVSLTAKNKQENTNITYQWSKYDDSDVYYEIEGETSASITVSENGIYRCEISDGYSTKYAYLCVNYNTGLTYIFDKYLENEDSDNYYEYSLDLYFVPGTSETVYLTAKNNLQNASFTYQWYKYDESEETNYEIEGETSASITVSEIGTYKCEISDGYSTNYAYLYVNYNTELTYIFDKYLENEDSDNCYGNCLDLYLMPETSETVSLTAKNNMENASFTYQWSKYDDSENRYYEIEGEKSASITVSEIGIYECKISDGYSTTYAYLYVNNNTELTYIFDKYLENEDSDNYYENDLDIYFELGTSEKVSLTAKNNMQNASFTYQWSKYDDSEHAYYEIEGEISASITISEISEVGKYRCEISDGYSISYAFLYVNYNTELTYIFDKYLENEDSDNYYGYNINLYIVPGTSETVYLTAKNNLENASFTYQWSKFDDSDCAYYDIEGETSASITVSEIGIYQCEISDGYSTRYAAIWVKYNTELTYIFDKYLVNDDSDYYYGDTLDLYLVPGTSEKVSLTAKNNIENASFTYQWSKYDDSEDMYYEIEGETSASITVSEIGTYMCEISDGYSTSCAYLYVNYGNTGLRFIFDKYLENEDSDDYYQNGFNLYLTPGTSEKVSLTAKNNLENASFTYQWRKYDDSENTYYEIEGETSASITVSEKGSYECEISDGYSTSYAYLYVNYNTELTYIFDKYLENEDSDNYYEYSLDLYFVPGTSETVYLTAKNNLENASFTYQWYKYDESEETNYEIEGETSASITVSEIGTYVCKISDGYSTIYAYLDVIYNE